MNQEDQPLNPEESRNPQDVPQQSAQSGDASAETPVDNAAMPEADGSQAATEGGAADLNDSPNSEVDAAELQRFQAAFDAVRDEIGKIIVGQEDAVELMVAAILTGGHVLLEGVPGIAKTLTAKLLSQSLELDFSRIQFTPDLMPSDVIGTSVYDIQNSSFSFRKGPVFSNIVLIDEINRAPAKTQAALFEVMEERQITHDGERYIMDSPFFVVATQNPIEQEGTYRLPEAQLDRFLFRIRMDYPPLDDEKMILKRFRNDIRSMRNPQVSTVLRAADIEACREIVSKVYVSDPLCDYIAELVHATRNNGSLYLGASPRASLAILGTSKAFALIQGRSFVTPDDIQHVAFPVLNHRVQLSSERELEGVEADQVIREIIAQIEVPR